MKSVLITGASTGIGAACAAFLDAQGFRVFAGVRKQADADRLQQSASSALTPVFVDIVDQASIARASQIVHDAVGERGLHGLVNNAGISVSGPLEFVPLDDFRRQFDVNVFGHVAATQQLLPMLRRAKGRIVNMSSIGGRSAAPFLGPYSMSKFALEAFSDALRRELYPWGIQVSCIEPGAIATAIWKKGRDAATPPAATKQLYGKAMEALRQWGAQASRNAAPAEQVARVVHHALTAPKAKTRYLVGRDARVLAMLTWLLPDRVLDAAFRRVFRVD